MSLKKVTQKCPREFTLRKCPLEFAHFVIVTMYRLSLKLPKLYDRRIASVRPKHVWHSSIGVRLNLSKAHLWNGAITPMLIIYQHGELWLKLTMKLSARRTRMHTYSDIVYILYVLSK